MTWNLKVSVRPCGTLRGLALRLRPHRNRIELDRGQLRASSSAKWSEAAMGHIDYAGLTRSLERFIPKTRIATDRLRRLSYGTDASFYRLIPEIVVTAESEGEIAGHGDPAGEPLPYTLHRLADKAGFELIAPRGGLCCGQPFDSKGFAAEADRKAEEAIGVLTQASESGRWPIFVDTSPCSQRLKAAAAERLQLLDIAEFLHDHVLPRVTIPEHSHAPVALHITCSTRRMGLEGKLLAVVQACASQVVVPSGIGCCAFAGDKGYTRQEMNAHALRALAPAIEGCEAGYSTSRTCEIGLSHHGGIPYRSIAHLLEWTAHARKRSDLESV